MKTFFTKKPRSEWKKPVRRKRKLVAVEDKKFWFELTDKGLEVRPKHGRKAKCWPWAALVNGVNKASQMELFAVNQK